MFVGSISARRAHTSSGESSIRFILSSPAFKIDFFIRHICSSGAGVSTVNRKQYCYALGGVKVLNIMWGGGGVGGLGVLHESRARGD